MSAPIDQLMEAKAARDIVRDQLVKAIRRAPSPWADDAATIGLSTALNAYDKLPDLTDEFSLMGERL